MDLWVIVSLRHYLKDFLSMIRFVWKTRRLKCLLPRRLKNLIGEKSMISYSDHCGVAQSREQTPPLAERVSKTHMIHELASGTESVASC